MAHFPAKADQAHNALLSAPHRFCEQIRLVQKNTSAGSSL